MATVAPDYMPGDPANHIIGKPDEKPAKKHAEQPPKPIKTARGILADIELRVQELEPLVKEYEMCKRLVEILTPVKPK